MERNQLAKHSLEVSDVRAKRRLNFLDLRSFGKNLRLPGFLYYSSFCIGRYLRAKNYKKNSMHVMLK